MNGIRTALLVAATMTTGLAAGVFALYAHTVLPGLGGTDDRTFVTAYAALDRSIVNPWFMASAFLGALVTTALAAATHLHRPALPWVLAALALYLVVVVVTVAVHLPLNDALKAAGVPHSAAEAASVRAAFHETRWQLWNLVRVVASVGAFGSLCVALLRTST